MTKTLTMTFILQRIGAALHPRWLVLITLLLLSLAATGVLAHGVAENDKLFMNKAAACS